MAQNKKKMLICGGTGFAGRNLAEHFVRSGEWEVHATHFSRAPWPSKDIIWHKVDLTDRKAVHELVEGVDTLLHYAAIATNFKDVVERPYIHTTDNVVMSSFLIRSAHEQGVRHFVFPSCGYLYNAGEKPFVEDDVDFNNLPRAAYGAAWSKVYLERMCDFYSGLGKTKFTVMRQANLYGPFDKTNLDSAHALPATIMKVLASETGSFEVWGDGSQKKDQLYISDLVDFVSHMVANKKNDFDFFNIGSGSFVTMKQIAEEAIRASGRDLKIEFNTDKPSNKLWWALDHSKATRETGWAPKVGFEEGMKRTTEWYRSLS